MAQQSDGVWVTINGRHVLIKEGETATDAINRSIAEHNQDLKEKQIAQRKAEADKLNQKPNSVKSDTGLWYDGEYDRVVSADEIKRQYDAMVENDTLDPSKKSLDAFAKDNFTELNKKGVSHYKEIGYKMPSKIVKEVTSTAKVRPNMRTDRGMAEVQFGKPYEALTAGEKKEALRSAEEYGRIIDRLAGKHYAKTQVAPTANKELYDTVEQVAKANKWNVKWAQMDAIKSLNQRMAEEMRKKKK